MAATALVSATQLRAETFVYFGEQPDGSEIYVQQSPPALRNDGRFQAWFRTVPKNPQPVTDSFGFERKYFDFLALNVGDCLNKTMAATQLAYRDEQGTVVARFDLPTREIEFRKVRGGTLGSDMLVHLCTPRPRSAKVPSASGEKPY